MNNYFEERQIKLANDLLNYACDTDIYEVFDNYDSEEEAIESILNDLQEEKSLKGVLVHLKGNLEHYKSYLEDNPLDIETEKLYNDTVNIYNDVKKYRKELKELEKGCVR